MKAKWLVVICVCVLAGGVDGAAIAWRVARTRADRERAAYDTALRCALFVDFTSATDQGDPRAVCRDTAEISNASVWNLLAALGSQSRRKDALLADYELALANLAARGTVQPLPTSPNSLCPASCFEILNLLRPGLGAGAVEKLRPQPRMQ